MTKFHRPLSANPDRPGPTDQRPPARLSARQAPDEWTSSGNFSFTGQALKGRRNPGRGQRHLNRLPVLEHVTHASRMSGPPKQHRRPSVRTQRTRPCFSKSSFKSSNIRIAVARPAPNTPPPGYWNGPTR
jgi:hypothetical protein